ncbi:ECF transporter S component [Natronolimnobius sp. AArcel1]|uniref:ECF transporter S component n=1 Tax=Natronolimnobius sp. AArcel1 TaxID=1679093 RepID=UPI0013EB5F13|nr:ECF transporter S component [Natronolimnobius sp. AArcel1]NGM71539.1 ECF transporter S component [Natronolimnobius sp. AArcel1]
MTYGSVRAFDADNGGWLGIAEGVDSEWKPQPLEEPPQFVGDPIRPRRAGVVFGGITNAWSSILGTWTALLALFVLGMIALGGTPAIMWWLVPPLVVLIGVSILDNALRYWWTTYRFDATGRLWECGRNSRPHRCLEAAQYRSVRTRTDRLLGTTTVELKNERSKYDESDSDVQPITIPALVDPDATRVLETQSEIDASTSRPT